MNFKYRSYQKELLDRDDISFDAISRNMYELNMINTWLGGHSVTLSGFKKILADGKKISICEIGCGGGDNLYHLKKWCDRKKVNAYFIGIDINKNCIEYARSRISSDEFTFIISDYRNYNFTEKPDIIFSSLFCHHFNDEDIIHALQWMRKNSAIGFYVNDLHRNALAYYAIKWITELFSRSYLVKNDAPLSVLRGFHKKEWEQLLKRSEINSYHLQWKWAFRWLIVSLNKTV
ncbi:MAG TPA: methyltransferase domain-containing protein [Puia sp.]|nr:methyltransferase domain-containing protein [Puia sp.]